MRCGTSSTLAQPVGDKGLTLSQIPALPKQSDWDLRPDQPRGRRVEDLSHESTQDRVDWRHVRDDTAWVTECWRRNVVKGRPMLIFFLRSVNVVADRAGNEVVIRPSRYNHRYNVGAASPGSRHRIALQGPPTEHTWKSGSIGARGGSFSVARYPARAAPSPQPSRWVRLSRAVAPSTFCRSNGGRCDGANSIIAQPLSRR